MDQIWVTVTEPMIRKYLTELENPKHWNCRCPVEQALEQQHSLDWLVYPDQVFRKGSSHRWKVSPEIKAFVHELDDYGDDHNGAEDYLERFYNWPQTFPLFAEEELI